MSVDNCSRNRVGSQFPELLSIGGGSLECHGHVVEGTECRLGGREMVVDCAISRTDYVSGACFGKGAPFVAPHASSSVLSKQFVPLKPNPISMSSLSKPLGKKGIALVPVDLISSTSHLSAKENTTKVKTDFTHWTAVW